MKIRSIARVTPLIYGILLATLPSALAFRDGDTTRVMLRQQLFSNLVKIQGTLSCEPKPASSGGNCLLKIHDRKSGKTYQVNRSVSARELYDAGKTEVVIEGAFTDEETLEVAQASAVN